MSTWDCKCAKCGLIIGDSNSNTEGVCYFCRIDDDSPQVKNLLSRIEALEKRLEILENVLAGETAAKQFREDVMKIAGIK